MNKFIFLAVTIRNGEYEFISKSIHKVDSNINVNKFAEETCKQFYGDASHKEGNEWYFNAGQVAVSLCSCSEITKEEYDVMLKYL